MNAYIYRAELYCEECGSAIRTALTAAGKAPADAGNECSYDSDNYPKGPYENGGGESDSPQQCAECGAYLHNPLTGDGQA